MTVDNVHAVLTFTCVHACVNYRREKEKLLSIFEVDLDRSRVKEKKLVTSSSLAVKEFVRSAAGTELAKPSLLRPAHVLLETTNYLINRYSILVVLPRVGVDLGLFVQVRVLWSVAVILPMRSSRSRVCLHQSRVH